MTLIEQLPPPHPNGVVTEIGDPYAIHLRRPRRTVSVAWRDKVVLALLFGGAFLSIVLLMLMAYFTGQALGALIHALRGFLL